MRAARSGRDTLLIMGFVVFSATVSATAGDEEISWLWGDWQGKRRVWAEQGIDFECVLTLEGVQNISGGIARSSRGLMNLDLIMDAEGQALGLSDEGTLHVYFLGNAGGHPTDMIGDLQTSSNIEAPEAFKLYEFWWQQRLAQDHLAWLLGLHDYNATFDALESAALFTNSSFGISPDISQLPPSIFPTTALAFMVSLFADQGWYMHGAVYDGVPGDPGDEQGTHVILKQDDGLFYAGEGGFQDKDTGTKLAVGAWTRTTDFTVDFSGISYTTNAGIYLIGETTWEDSWAGFFQLGHADKNRNQVGDYVGAGLTYTGWLACDDTIGLGVACAYASHGYRTFNPGMDDYELTIEVTYQCHPRPWLTLQPDLQFIQHPGMDATLDDALALGLRAMIAF